jgi:hypothetical protein
MAISIGDSKFTEAAFNFVLSEGFDYDNVQDALNAYRLAVLCSDRTIEQLEIRLSGLTLPSKFSESPSDYTGHDLVDAVDCLVGSVSLGIQYFHESIVSNTSPLNEKDAEDNAMAVYLRKYASMPA